MKQYPNMIQDNIAEFLKNTSKDLACPEGVAFLDDVNKVMQKDNVPTTWDDDSQEMMYRDMARMGFDLLLATMKIMKDAGEFEKADSSSHDASRN